RPPNATLFPYTTLFRSQRMNTSFEHFGRFEPPRLDIADLGLDALQFGVQLHQLLGIGSRFEQGRMQLVLLGVQLVELALQPAELLLRRADVGRGLLRLDL